MARDSLKALRAENEELRLRLEEAQDALEAIRTGQVESLVVDGPDGPRIFSLEGASQSYRALVEAMNEGAATLSEQGTILYCNGRFARMLDAPLEQVMGSELCTWISPDLRAAMDALLAQAREGDARAELRMRTEQGRELPAQLSLSSLIEGGRPVLCLVAVDLSEQKRNERVLAEGRLSRSVLEQAADAIIVCDVRGCVTRTSRVAEQLCGCRPACASFDAAFPVRLASPLLSKGLAATALRGGVIRAEPGSLVRVDGSRAELLVSATPLKDSDEQILGCVITLVDVTESRRSEEALRTSEERIRTLGDNLPDGAVYRYEQDAHGRPHFVYISAGIERLTGVSSSEVLHNPEALLETIVPEDRARLAEAEARSRETLAPMSVELRQRHARTGEARWTLLRSVPRRMPGGVTVWDGLQFDITDRKRAEDALREADQNKNHFLAMLSHELRNPLMPVRNSLYLLQRATPGGEQARRAQTVIQRQIDHIARLIDDLLDVTRIARGKVQLHREGLDLGDLVRGTVEDQRVMFEQAGVNLEVALPDGELSINADRTRLSQIVGNLLNNAAKFTPRGGSTRVSLERADDGTATLRIRDDGSGMEPEMLEKLFQPFAQADLTLDRSRGGLGLGLSLVKGLVELHGGTVMASSEGLGKGAEFVVRLPLESARAQTPEADSNRAPKAQPRRVLIIEDNRDAAESLRDVLEFDEHRVEVAGSGPEGLELARRFRPELVLCDIGLPGMDGYEVARAFRSDPGLKDAFLVALSGYAAPEDLAEAAAAGFNRHLAKPPSLEQIERVIMELTPTAPEEAIAGT